MIFDVFNKEARRTVVMAQEESRMLNHNFLGTEHILLGILDAGESIGAEVLTSFGLTLQNLRKQIEERVGVGQQCPSGHIPFTPRAKRVLELALRESTKLANNDVGTAHILLALISAGESTATTILETDYGLDLHTVGQRILARLGGLPVLLLTEIGLTADSDKKPTTELIGHQTTLTIVLKHSVNDTEAQEILALIDTYLDTKVGTRTAG